jgi:flagellar hook-basal body complex protein FliE
MSDIRTAGLASLGAIAQSAPRRATPDAAGDVRFGDLIAAGLRDATRSVSAAEVSAIAGLTGAMPVQEVVSAVMGAEQKLQLAVSVRDKIVAAYLEVSRMQI